MIDRERLLGGVGLIALLVGLALIVGPEFARDVAASSLLVSLIGVVALVQALRVLDERRGSRVDSADVDRVESRVSVPTPGTAFDGRRVEEGSSIAARRERDAFRDRLREAAETVLRHRGDDPETADRRLRDGTWTADPYAAAFLGNVEAPRPSLRERLRRLVRRESGFERGARRTADAIVVAASNETVGSEPADRENASGRPTAPGREGERQRSERALPDERSRHPWSSER